jgi:hypothetical protein
MSEVAGRDRQEGRHGAPRAEALTDWRITAHAAFEMHRRGISEQEIRQVLADPEQRLCRFAPVGTSFNAAGLRPEERVFGGSSLTSIESRRKW